MYSADSKRMLYPTCVCYHGCAVSRAGALTFRELAGDIKTHVLDLLRAGYTLLLPRQYKQWQQGTLHIDGPVTCLHFDDCLDSITQIVPWLIAQGLPCGIAIITRRLGKRDAEGGFATWAQVREWVATGLVEVMSHTHNLHHLTLLRNSTGAVDVGPVLEGPCWIDGGDVVYRAPGDPRWYWDFTHVDSITLGVPLWGTDPYDALTPIVTTLSLVPKVSGAVQLLRLWMALSKPSGSGYDAQVELRANGALVWSGVIVPKQYETRSQWVEREFYTLELTAPFDVTAGVALSLEFITLNVGNGAALLYGLTTRDDTAFRAVTNCQGLFAAGSQGAPNRYWQYIDYPAGDRWPVIPCLILATGTGRDATMAEYTGYVADDCATAASTIATYLPAQWTEQVAFDTRRDHPLAEVAAYVPVGWNNPDRVDAVLDLAVPAPMLVETVRIHVGRAEFFMGGDAFYGLGNPLYSEQSRQASERSYPATFELAVGSGTTWAVVGQAAIWRISKGVACDVTPFACPVSGLQLRIRPINGGPTSGDEKRTRWGVRRIELGARSTPVPAPAPDQLVYPFGSYNGGDDAVVQARPGFKDVSPELRAVFTAAGLTHGYTIQAVRNVVQGQLREPDLRQSEYALGRWLVVGTQDPRHSVQNLRAYSGYLWPDVPHRGVRWQVSIEADPLGNATVRDRAAVLDFVAFDAWAFDGAGGLVAFPLNDGGTYAGAVYADDKSFLQARGVACLLIINNNLGTGEPDAAIGDHVVSNPAVYVPQIVATAVAGGWDGITCNLEALSPGSRELATVFYRELARAMHAAGKLVHATVPAPTGTDYDADFWVAWCDHAELAKVCDGIKVMSYTETGAGTAPGPAAPDWFWLAVYDRIRAVVPEPYWPRILCGCRAFGHQWDTAAPDDAVYQTYHQAIAGALTYALPITVDSTEMSWTTGRLTTWCGTPMTVDRAQREAARHGFAGIGLWKADDGDLQEFFPTSRQLGTETMQAFIEQRFPPEYSWGAEGGPRYRTHVGQTDSGATDRAATWTFPLASYKFSRDLLSQEHHEAMLAFFRLRAGRAVGFRWKDWTDFRFNAGELGEGDGVRTNWPLRKRYSVADADTGVQASVLRPITKPVPGTVRAFKDGVEQASGWSINTATGLLSFLAAPAPGVVVSASCEFDVPVCFDSDSLRVVTDKSYGTYSWASMGVEEIRV